jgi:aspartate kinase
MLELAANGAKVLYIRAVEYARRHGVMINARSTFSSGRGTFVLGPGMSVPDSLAPDSTEESSMEEPIVAGVATDLGQAKITVIGVPDVPGKAAEIFTVIAKSGANVDMIVQNVSGQRPVAPTSPSRCPSRMPRPPCGRCRRAGGHRLREPRARRPDRQAVRRRRRHAHPLRVSATLFEALSTAGVNIEMISTSEIRISVVLRGDELAQAARGPHRLRARQ